MFNDITYCPGGNCPKKEACYRYVRYMQNTEEHIWTFRHAMNKDDECFEYIPV